MTTTLALRPAPRLAPAPLRDRLPVPPPSPGAVQEALDLEFVDRTEPVARRQDTPGPALPGLVQAIIEVLEGRRSPVVLQRVVAADVLSALVRRSSRRDRATPPGRGPFVLRLRVTTPRAKVCECAAVVVVGGRVRAMALRLRYANGRWVVDALELG